MMKNPIGIVKIRSMVIIKTLEGIEIIKLFCDREITYDKIEISEDLENNLYFKNNNNIMITLTGNFEFIYDLEIGKKYIIVLDSYFFSFKNSEPIAHFIPEIECYMVNFTITSNNSSINNGKIEFIHRKNIDGLLRKE